MYVPCLNFQTFSYYNILEGPAVAMSTEVVIHRRYFYKPLYHCFNTVLQGGILPQHGLTSYSKVQFQCFVANQVLTQIITTRTNL